LLKGLLVPVVLVLQSYTQLDRDMDTDTDKIAGFVVAGFVVAVFVSVVAL
jgi:hypothetical protein